MLPAVALVGRPNVGKSTLFNRLTRTRDALVADYAGLTRDRIHRTVALGGRPCLLIDTGGLTDARQGIEALTARQVEYALEEADAIVVVVDAREGLTPADQAVAERVRRAAKPVWIAVNKAEGLEPYAAVAEFHALGLGEPLAVSATHGDGVRRLAESVAQGLPEAATGPETTLEGAIGVAVAGRPNVGKSTLVNRILGEDRVVVCDEPGTTRDSILVPFERGDRRFVLVDTAGVRRRGRVRETVERFSVVKALQAMDAAHVVVVVMDAREGVTEQDVSLAGYALERGCGLVVAVNKWDGLERDQRDWVRKELDRRLAFAAFAPRHLISALHGTGVGELLDSVMAVFDAADRSIPTPELTRILNEAVHAHQPPVARGGRIKLRYAHQGGQHPPLIVVHGNRTDLIPDTYRRYLANTFRKALELQGTPVRVVFRSGTNPYADDGSR